MNSTRDLAPIQSGSTYPLNEFARRAGLGKQALRTARRQGLKVRRLGNRSYVRGDDFHEFVGTLTVVDGNAEA